MVDIKTDKKRTILIGKVFEEQIQKARQLVAR